jgi:peptidoglycan/LPS O-acetylase OafA/YrhL
MANKEVFESRAVGGINAQVCCDHAGASGMTYNPALDGVRAVAIIVVMLFHARAPTALGGYIGVDVFFVLSGYLITTLLLQELQTNHRIDLRRFYLRRLIRLAPALLVMLAIYVIVAPFVWPSIADHGWQAFLAAIYLSDYSVAFWGTPDILSHTWSLSIEEHFYLLWPVVLAFAVRRWDRRSLVIVLGVFYVLATLFRWVCVIRGSPGHRSTIDSTHTCRDLYWERGSPH